MRSELVNGKRIRKDSYGSLFLTDTTVSLKDAGRRKLTQLVAHHVLGNKNRDEGFSVVNGEVVTDEVRSYHGAAAPGLDGLFIARLDCGVDFEQKLLIDVRAFFQ